jgi:hypothetical protein
MNDLRENHSTGKKIVADSPMNAYKYVWGLVLANKLSSHAPSFAQPSLPKLITNETKQIN